MECDTDTTEESRTLDSKKIVAETGAVEPPIGKRMRPNDHAEYERLVDQLADRLKIARHPDSLVTIKAARLLIENIIVSAQIDQLQPSSEGGSQTSERASRAKQSRQTLSCPSSATINGDNIRIQQTKFNLDDVSLPSSLVTSWLTMNKQNNNYGASATGDDDDDISSEARRALGWKDELKVVLERASKSLKLLYLNDQKQLQLRVNEIISSIQSITANPKTDSKLLATNR